MRTNWGSSASSALFVLLYLRFCVSSNQWKNTAQQRFYLQFDRRFYMKTIITVIPTNLFTTLFLPLFCFFVEIIVPPPNRHYNMRDTGIYDPVLIRENTDQWKPVFSHILCSARSRLVPTVIQFRRPNIFSYLHNFQVNQEKYNLQHRCKKRLRFIKWIITESE